MDGMEELREPRSALMRERPSANWSADRWACEASQEEAAAKAAVGVWEGVAGGAGERRELVELVRLRAPLSMLTQERRRSCLLLLLSPLLPSGPRTATAFAGFYSRPGKGTGYQA